MKSPRGAEKVGRAQCGPGAVLSLLDCDRYGARVQAFERAICGIIHVSRRPKIEALENTCSCYYTVLYESAISIAGVPRVWSEIC